MPVDQRAVLEATIQALKGNIANLQVQRIMEETKIEAVGAPTGDASADEYLSGQASTARATITALDRTMAARMRRLEEAERQLEALSKPIEQKAEGGDPCQA